VATGLVEVSMAFVSLGNDKFKRCRCRDEGDGIVESVLWSTDMGFLAVLKNPNKPAPHPGVLDGVAVGLFEGGVDMISSSVRGCVFAVSNKRQFRPSRCFSGIAMLVSADGSQQQRAVGWRMALSPMYRICYAKLTVDMIPVGLNGPAVEFYVRIRLTASRRVE
jgi:hypothetical protein